MDLPKKKTTKIPVPASAAFSKGAKSVTPEERTKMVEQAAYYIAEKDGFKGNPHEYWVSAEAQIESMLKKK